MKTNKSLQKRLKITKHGKVLARPSGHNHFNAKERRVKQLLHKGLMSIQLTTKQRSRYLPYQ